MIQSAMSTQGTERSNHGVITSVRGSVVDVRFDDGLPPIYTLLRTGEESRIAIEVLMQLDVQLLEEDLRSPCTEEIAVFRGRSSTALLSFASARAD